MSYIVTNEEGHSTAFKDMPKDHEYLWDKVQRERKENHYLYLGGNYKHFIFKSVYQTQLMKGYV